MSSEGNFKEINEGLVSYLGEHKYSKGENTVVNLDLANLKIKDNKIMWEYDWIYNLQQICIADINEDGYFEIYFLHSGSARTEFYCYNKYNHINTGMGWTYDKLEFKCENDKLFIGDKLVSKTYVEPSEGYRDVFFLQSDTYMLIADIGYEDINSKSTLFVETLALYTGETIVVDHSEKFTSAGGGSARGSRRGLQEVNISSALQLIFIMMMAKIFILI